MSRDAWLVFATRFIRLFAYGALSVVLVFYLIGAGLTESRIGLLLTLTLVGDTVVSLHLTDACRSHRPAAHAEDEDGREPEVAVSRRTCGTASTEGEHAVPC